MDTCFSEFLRARYKFLDLSFPFLLLPLFKKKVDSFVRMYPGVAHGWTVRYNVEDKKAVQSAEEAHQDMLNWFAKHVK